MFLLALVLKDKKIFFYSTRPSFFAGYVPCTPIQHHNSCSFRITASAGTKIGLSLAEIFLIMDFFNLEFYSKLHFRLPDHTFVHCQEFSTAACFTRRRLPMSNFVLSYHPTHYRHVFLIFL